MSIDFWIGILVSIPIGLAVNLLTPRAGDWLGKYGRKVTAAWEAIQKKRRERTEQGRKKEIERIKAKIAGYSWLHADQSRLTNYLFRSLFWCIQVMAGGLIIAIGFSVLVAAPVLAPFRVFVVVGAILIVVITLELVAMIAKDAYRTIKALRNFEKWKARQESEIQRIERGEPANKNDW